MSWSIAGIVAIISGLFYWWIGSMITAPFEDVAIQTANTTSQYGYWWFAPALTITLAVGGTLSLIAIFNR